MLTKIRNRQRGFTLIELLIVIAIIGIIAALLIPNFLDALQKAKQKRTLADMRNTGTAMFAWLTDQQGAAAAGQTGTPASVDFSKFGGDKTSKDVSGILVPQYTNTVPEKDAWKNTIKYYLNTASNQTTQVMGIVSGGRDGSTATSYQSGAFSPTAYEEDLVWADGYFVRWPQNLTAAAAPVAP